MEKISKIDSLIVSVFKVSDSDTQTIVAAANKFAEGDLDVRKKAPVVEKKISLLAWTLMVVYRESPSRVFLGVFCIFFLFPFFLFLNLFS